MRLLFFIFLIASCGTETGNPVRSPAENSPSAQIGSANYSAAYRVGVELCTKLNDCDQDLSVNTCLEQLYPLTTIASRLGLSGGTYANYQAVINAELADEITNSPDPVIECVNTIADYDCSLPPITTYYNSTSPSNFSSIHNLLPLDVDSCGGIFATNVK